jgi:hypothetical protein
LADRAARLEWLIQFINENGALNRINSETRTLLATHAEKIAAAQGIWAWYDGANFKGPATAAGVGSRGTERSQNILVQAIALYEEEGNPDGGGSSKARRRSGIQVPAITPTSSVAAGEISPDTDEERMADVDSSWPNARRQPNQEQERVPTGYVDPVRKFFKYNIEEIGLLVPCSVKVVKATINSYEKAKAWPSVMTQAGRLALVCSP